MEKMCSKCGGPNSDGQARPDRPGQSHSWCRKCKAKAGKEWRQKNRSHHLNYMKEYRELNKEKIQAANKKRGSEWYKKNKDRHKITARASDLKSYWPELSRAARLERYDSMRIAQDYKCKICQKPESELTIALSVDHCHKTNKIRGLLCGNCNRGLGMFFDNPDLLRAATDYVDHSATSR